MSGSSATARPAVSLMSAMCSRGVDAADLGLGCRPWFLDRDAFLPELGGDSLHDLESLDPFRMPRRRQMIGEDGRREQSQ